MTNVVYRIFKKPFFGRFSKPWRWSETVDQKQWQRLNVESESGATIAALIGSSHILKAKGAVLMSHPMGVIAKGFWMKWCSEKLLKFCRKIKIGLKLRTNTKIVK